MPSEYLTGSKDRRRFTIYFCTALTSYDSNLRNILPKDILTGNRFCASSAPLGEELAEALGTVWLLITGRETLTSQRLVAVSAGEAVPVPGLVLVRHTAAGDDLRENIIRF